MTEKDKRQYHFVVHYDAETGEFEMDYETQDGKFIDGPVYNPENDTWEDLAHNEHLDDDNSTYNRSADALAEAIRDLKLREIWDRG